MRDVGRETNHEVNYQLIDFHGALQTCQQVQAEHQQRTGMLKPLFVLKSKWDEVAMNFILGLPKVLTREDFIWVVVNCLTKTANFIHMKVKDPIDKLARLYVQNIVRLHGVPSAIVSDRDSQFTSRFWQSLHKEMGQSLSLVLLFTRKRMVSRSELTKSWRICYQLVYWT